MEGRGRYWYFKQLNSSSILYVGEMKDNSYNGLGKLIFQDGTNYYGSFLNNHMSSERGVILFANGDKYKGPIKGGWRNGLGEYTSQNMNFQGNFKEDLREGSGKVTYTTHDAVIRYEGNFEDDRRCGKCDTIEITDAHSKQNLLKFNGELDKNEMLSCKEGRLEIPGIV